MLLFMFIYRCIRFSSVILKKKIIRKVDGHVDIFRCVDLLNIGIGSFKRKSVW